MKYIQDFIKELNIYYPDLYINFEYIKDDDVYEIYYNKKDYKYRDDFKQKSGELIYKYFYSNKFYDFFFDYSCERYSS